MEIAESLTHDKSTRVKLPQRDKQPTQERLSKLPSPSRLGPILVCFAFTPKPFPIESRRVFEIRHRLAFLMGVKELVEKHGCVLSANGFEKNVESGIIDGELIDPSGNPTTLEATGSDWIKLQKIIQACVYQANRDGRVWVSSINERMECPPSLIRAINNKVPELVTFRNQYPEIATRLYMPHRDICPLCDNAECPHWKANGGESHYVREEVQTH